MYKTKQVHLGLFSLAMITAGSVASIRNLPSTAVLGPSLVVMLVLALLFFLLPSALVAAELSLSSKQSGGVYAWVKQAFGMPSGFLAVWFQWIQNIVWYPIILSFIAGTVGHLLSSTGDTNKWLFVCIILGTFWLATLMNLGGVKISAKFSNICAVLGLLLPMVFIIVLGLFWLLSGKPLSIHFHQADVFPFHDRTLWIAITGLVLSCCGMEIAAVYGNKASPTEKAYPYALLIAGLIVVVTYFCGSLSIAFVLPKDNINLSAGVIQAFDAFFNAYGLNHWLPVMAIILIIGALGSVHNWISASTRGLLLALQELSTRSRWSYTVDAKVPPSFLILQAGLVSIVVLIFLWMPSVNAAYWFLTALAAQLYMLMYIFMFLAVIRLKYKSNEKNKVIPGKKVGLWTVAVLGLLGSLFTFVFGFIPPTDIGSKSIVRYEVILGIGLLVSVIVPLLVVLLRRRRLAGLGLVVDKPLENR